jgi:hypothetical protein
LNVATDWTEIPITFRAKCGECGTEILPGPALWSDSTKSAKHLNCGRLSSQTEEAKTLPSSKPHIVSQGKEFEKFRDPHDNTELKCFICGKMAGCNSCTFSQICDRKIVSQLCICQTCSNLNNEDALERYQQVFIQKYSHSKR